MYKVQATVVIIYVRETLEIGSSKSVFFVTLVETTRMYIELGLQNIK